MDRRQKAEKRKRVFWGVHRTGLFWRDADGAGVYRIGSAGRGGLKDLPFFSPNSMS
jgi:hypothetical protein